MGSISANEIKSVKSLSQKKFRDEKGLFVVEGEKMVREAQASGFEIEKIYREEEIGADAMQRMSQCQTAPPCLAVVRHRELPWSKKDSGLFLALDSIRDPGNLGTIIRIADWFGLDGILATSDTVELYNPKVVQASMGAVFRMPVKYVASLKDALTSEIANGASVYGTLLDGEDIYKSEFATGSDNRTFLVIGNESNGISAEVRPVCTGKLLIPPFPASRHGSESLNAAVATAVAVAEFRRRSR